MENVENIIEPPRPIIKQNISNNDILLGKPIPPIDRLKYISSDDFEELISEWIYGYLIEIKGKVYSKIKRNGGAGDKGRDVIAVYENDDWDNYQCKYYKDPLMPTNIYLELGKLCYYTFIKDYTIPQNYYFVSPKGVGPTLNDLIDNPKNLNKELIDNWNKYCRYNITDKKEILLEDKFLDYVEKFDFNIISSIEPQELIEQFRQTRYFALRFGGGLTKTRPVDIKPPSDIRDSELTYTGQIFLAYSEHKKNSITSVTDLETYPELKSHFQRQRENFYCADSLNQFSRDALPIESNCFENFKNEIFDGVIEIVSSDHSDGYEKLQATIQESVRVSISNSPLQSYIKLKDKKGICHHLVNESRIKWVKD